MTDGRGRQRRRKNVIPPSPVKLLSVRETARKYGFHENTVRRWINEDGLRCVRYGPGNKIFIPERDVEDFIEKYYDW